MQLFLFIRMRRTQSLRNVGQRRHQRRIQNRPELPNQTVGMQNRPRVLRMRSQSQNAPVAPVNTLNSITNLSQQITNVLVNQLLNGSQFI